MLRSLALFLPVVVPSWRFFDVIAPSPRIEFAVLTACDDEASDWREFRPRPDVLSVFDLMKRIVWNPHWNENLFLMSCAERLMKGEEDFARQQIFQCLHADVIGSSFVQFRLVFYVREGEEVERHIVYMSPIEPMSDGAVL